MQPLTNNPAAAAALDVYKQLSKIGPPDQLNNDVGDSRGLFVTGRCALSLDWGDIGTLAIDTTQSKVADKVGTIILPAMLILLRSPFLFGYAKPVPVNFRRLDRPRRDMVWVALAGPGTNVLLAIVSSLLFYGVGLMPASPAEWLAENLIHSIQINAVLCVFNMLPLPPLDGGRVAVGLLPDALAFPLARLERYGMLILLLFLFVIPYVGEQTGYDLNILAWLIGAPTEALIRLVLAITGQSG